MSVNSFTESIVEQAASAGLESKGYQIPFGPVIALGEEMPEPIIRRLVR